MSSAGMVGSLVGRYAAGGSGSPAGGVCPGGASALPSFAPEQENITETQGGVMPGDVNSRHPATLQSRGSIGTQSMNVLGHWPRA